MKMASYKKRVLAIFLAILMCTVFLPMSVSAEEAEDNVISEEDVIVEEVPEDAAQEQNDEIVEDVIEEEAGEASAADSEDAVLNEEEDDLVASADPVADFVERGYSLMLGREADEGGLKFYADQLKAGTLTGAQMVSSFMNSPEFNNNGYTNEQIVTIVYKTMLDREPDPGGLQYHTNNLNNGICYDSLINNFSQSDEFKGICEKAGIVAGSLDTEWIDKNPQVAAFVMRNYQLALERRAAGSELNYYCEILLNRTLTPQQVAHNFVFSPECVGRNLGDRDFIVMLYHLYMDREPEEGGLNYYLNLLSSGTSREAVEAGFGASPEFKNIVAGYGLAPEGFERDGVYYEVIDTATARVKSYSGASASVTVLGDIEGYAVVEIGAGAFEGNQAIQSIDLPDSITVIGARAFKNCTNLKSMT